MISVSVIIPTLNEEERIQPLLSHLRGLERNLEIIVVDGGSGDETRDRATGLARVIRAPRGRSSQMNAGVRVARGEVLWFLHADCRPHSDSLKEMRRVLADPRISGGAFTYALDGNGAFFRVSETLSNWKNRVFGLVYGDMGIFVRAETFRAMGGYADIPLMEDMDLCRRLKKTGRMVILRPRIMTSARRWKSEGAVRNVVRNWALQAAWTLGTSPKILARHYSFGEDERGESGIGLRITANGKERNDGNLL